jgi:threonine/homoserine/homoserine lactone efflux protein
MITLPTALTFAGLAFVMALSPGPNLIYLASRSICQGTSAGFASLAGVCSGMLVYMLAAAAGLSALFVAVPIAYDVIRLVGVVYLVWLALQSFRSHAAFPATASLPPEPYWLLFRRGLFTCLLNPKVMLLYGALLPQFVVPSAGGVFAQTVLLGIVQVVAAASAHSCVILSASTLASLLNRIPFVLRAQKYLLSAFLLSLAFRVAVERRNVV